MQKRKRSAPSKTRGYSRNRRMTIGSEPEKRYPRADCTKVLASVLARVDATPERLVEYKSKMNFFPFARDWGTLRVRINRIWVWGSYARGATECGDVDLLIDAHIQFVDDVWFRDAPDINIKERKLHVPEWNQAQYVPYWRNVDSKLLGPFRKPLDRASCTLLQSLGDKVTQHNQSLTRDEVMEHAILVWRPGMAWRVALANIKADPGAGRFPDAKRRLK